MVGNTKAGLTGAIACSSAGSLPEVVQGNVAFFLPGNHNELVDAVLSIVEGKVTKLPEKKFLWSTTLNDVETLYRKVGNTQ